MDAIIEHTLSKWPKFQVVTATKKNKKKYEVSPGACNKTANEKANIYPLNYSTNF